MEVDYGGILGYHKCFHQTPEDYLRLDLAFPILY
jgi:hypothetical protein